MPGTRLSTMRSSSFCSGKPICRCRQRRFSASPRLRSLLEVRITVGGTTADDGAELGDRDLEVGEDFEQQRFELGVRLVDLVDQQHAAGGLLQRLQQRPRLDEFLGEEHVAEIVQLVERRHAASRRRRALRRACPSGSGCRAAAWRISTHRAPWPRRGPRSTAGGSSSGRASAAIALASSVLPTPAGPSTRIGLSICCDR